MSIAVDKTMVRVEDAEVCLAFVLSAPGRQGETARCDATGDWVSVPLLLTYGWTDATLTNPEKISVYSTYVPPGSYLVRGHYGIHVRSRDGRYAQTSEFDVTR